MTARRFVLRQLSGLRRDARGNAIIEFALIGPAMLLTLLAVFQIALHIQNYNAVRNLAADGSRFAVVEYQKGAKSSGPAIETWVRAKALSGVYNLDTDRLTVTVTPVVISRLTGMNEMMIVVSYEAPQYLWSVAGDALNISYSRAVFLPV